MNNKNKGFMPDYDSWRDVATWIDALPPNRFYFVVTVLSLAAVAYMVSDSVLALGVVVALILAFTTSVFLMQWRCSSAQKQDCPAESSGFAGTADEIGTSDRCLEFVENDGHCPPGSCGLRKPLEGQKERAADHCP